VAGDPEESGIGELSLGEHGYFDIVNPDIPTGVYCCGHIRAGRMDQRLSQVG
jgi:hypothetical protein